MCVCVCVVGSREFLGILHRLHAFLCTAPIGVIVERAQRNDQASRQKWKLTVFEWRFARLALYRAHFVPLDRCPPACLLATRPLKKERKEEITREPRDQPPVQLDQFRKWQRDSCVQSRSKWLFSSSFFSLSLLAVLALSSPTTVFNVRLRAFQRQQPPPVINSGCVYARQPGANIAEACWHPPPLGDEQAYVLRRAILCGVSFYSNGPSLSPSLYIYLAVLYDFSSIIEPRFHLPPPRSISTRRREDTNDISAAECAIV